jgi:hypothetical protein
MASPTQPTPTTPTPASKKRKPSELTPRAIRPASPAESIASVEDVDMADRQSAPPEDQIQTAGAANLAAEMAAQQITDLVWTFGTPDEIFDSDDWKAIMQAMRLQLQGEYDRLDTVLYRQILAANEDEWQLSRQIYNSFKGAREPSRVQLKVGILWCRDGKPKGGTLAANLELTYRSVKNRSFGWLTPLQACWPPAVCISNVNAASAVWDFKLNCPPGHDSTALDVLGTKLAIHYKGAFFAVVRAMLI